MKKEDLRIVFMGTPAFAVESLKALVENRYNVVGVITTPDKPAGRGYQMQASEVKKYALAHDLLLLQPEKLKNEVFLNELQQLNADLQIVVAFRMLPEVVWNMPRFGTFNLHASLLPQYRGAAPINWAIINGEKETGVTTFFLSHEIDTGKIIFQERIPINDDDNAGTLHDKLMKLGAELVLKTVDAILENSIDTIPQNELISDETILKPAPKIFKETCRINWDDTATNIRNLIRGLSPMPAAWTELILPDQSPLTLKIYESEIVRSENDKMPGTIISDHKNYMDIATREGYLRILDLQIAGKKRMNIKNFLNGFQLSEGTKVR
ncbi:MAG: methionyl-tRNA formyltransferase [Bacteroidota bacterium]|jgi:methionyl-tRNA formyltransferase|nr:methionyl-tRNA formyltransferase [Bacteroidota bacterium]PLB86898.1 methionyl-tRNA formyltransferase [Dysgonamonadaceae bacterium]